MDLRMSNRWLINYKFGLGDVENWLSANKLKLNPDKTEFIILGSKIQCEKLNKSFPVNILGNFLSPAEAVRNLGVWFESDVFFLRHVQDICKSCFAQIRDLKNALVGRIVTNTTKYPHITPVRKTLQWLPIEHRSIFKTALLVC